MTLFSGLYRRLSGKDPSLEKTILERRYGGEFLVSEANGDLSREVVTIAMGTVLGAGAVLGKKSVGGVAGAAAPGNVGNGVISGVAVGAAGTQVGTYEAVCIEAAVNGGRFEVIDPQGVTIGDAVVGTAFVGQVNFTIADGATDFLAGDRFLVTIAEGGDQYTGVTPAANDGSEVADCILYDEVDATLGPVKAAVIKRHAEYNSSIIPWGAMSGPQIATAKAQLAQHALIERVGI